MWIFKAVGEQIVLGEASPTDKMNLAAGPTMYTGSRNT